MENSSYNDVEILDALENGDNETIRSAAFAAGDACLETAIPLLCERIKSENIGVQEAAEYGLRKIRGPQAINGLMPLLASDDAPVRNGYFARNRRGRH